MATAPTRSTAARVSARPSFTRSTSTRLAPSAAGRAAVARPMPPPAPVTTPALPVNRDIRLPVRRVRGAPRLCGGATNAGGFGGPFRGPPMRLNRGRDHDLDEVFLL